MSEFNPDDPTQVKAVKERYVLGEKERVLSIVHKHPAYLIFLFVVTLAVYLLVVVISLVLVPAAFKNDTGAVYRIVAYVAMFLAVLIGLIFVIASFLYSQTKIIISSENLIQVLQQDLLHSRTSRLALTDIEDVTAEQHGFLATLLGYGTLTIETAGEQANFVFSFCPRPNYIAKALIDAKEQLIDSAPYSHE
jgi:uncharacterized membrane protein YdbT with pleckstrin-like domain